ncbi:MAG: pitrilysin family protein [Rhodothermia bacterium]|nr:MAG: pitrilysin family protein [Rhodothermia bacterium]
MTISDRSSTGQFQKTTLPNGIRVLSESILSVRSISMGIWIDAGSRDEMDEDAGICHFIEHMVFKGTANRRLHQIAQRMESVGGYLNAFTTKEFTCFYARALDEHLERALDTLSDLILSPSFPPKELEKEKDVVIEEMRMYEDSPEDFAFDLMEGQLYKEHPMGRPIIGNEITVRSFDRQRLSDFVDSYFSSDRTIVTVAGNVDHNRLVKLVENRFNQSNRRENRAPRIPLNGYTPGTVVSRKPIQQAHLILGTRTFGAHDDNRIALSVLNTLLGGGMSSVLNQNIRERYGYCYSIYSFANLHSDTGEFGVYMGTDSKKIDRSKKLIFRELAKVASSRLSDRKLQAVRNQVKGSVMLGLESMDSRMMRLGRQEVYYKKYWTLDDILEQVEAVSSGDLQVLAEQIFNPDQFSVVELIPENLN